MNWFKKILRKRSKSLDSTISKAKEIDVYLKEERTQYELLQKEPKLLILGSSDSGKSTLLKQLQIIHGGGFSDEQKALAIIHIRQNIFSGCTSLLSQITNSNNKSEPTDPAETDSLEILYKPSEAVPVETIPELDIPRVPLKQDYSGL